MNSSIDVERLFDKIEHTLMIKRISNLEIEESAQDLLNCIIQYVADVIFNDK